VGHLDLASLRLGAVFGETDARDLRAAEDAVRDDAAVDVRRPPSTAFSAAA
jgi:hypothetical protein